MSDNDLLDAIELIIVAGVAMTNAAISRAEDGRELTFPQWRVLVVLSDPDGLPVAEVARRIDVTLPATGRQLRRLAHRGLVVLEPDGRDRRVTRVRLTDAGLTVRARIIGERRAAIGRSVAELTLTRSAVRDVGRVGAALSVHRAATSSRPAAAAHRSSRAGP